MAKPGDIWISPCKRMELRCGRWQDVLADVTECDAVICDPPYSERTHGGHRGGATVGDTRQDLHYANIDDNDLTAFSARWSMCLGWSCVFSDHSITTAWEAVFTIHGRTGFAPIPCVIRGMTVRLAGDGPSSWATYLNVSRPKALHRWGTLDGAYVGSPGNRVFIGAKPLWLMRAIVNDYSRPGDLVVDPCAGSGTTLLAAAIEGRRAIGAEMDPKTYALAVKRLSAGYTPRMILPNKPKPKQTELEIGGQDGNHR